MPDEIKMYVLQVQEIATQGEPPEKVCMTPIFACSF